MRHLVLWSGGPDSTLALHDALTKTSDPVVAFHADIAPSPRWQHERAAVRRIYDHLRTSIRSFDLVTAQVQAADVPDMMLLVPQVAGLLNRYGDIKVIWGGEDARFNGDDSFDRDFQEAIRLCVTPSRFPKTPLNFGYRPIPGTNRTKQQIRTALGEQLWAMAWSCRSPVNNEPCGACHPCQDVRSTHA
jgi:7-cyano-7-deazaguanine synthase in queuosine biosynthesis